MLGILYESYIHPLTILSTLPSAGVGALLALRLCSTDLSVIALIGIILLIGIVKKNAIMMIDFALDAERVEGKTPSDAIYEACLLRFRPITHDDHGRAPRRAPARARHAARARSCAARSASRSSAASSSARLLTLFTTPVVYLYMDPDRDWLGKRVSRWFLFFGLSGLPFVLFYLDVPSVFMALGPLPIVLLVAVVGRNRREPDASAIEENLRMVEPEPETPPTTAT